MTFSLFVGTGPKRPPVPLDAQPRASVYEIDPATYITGPALADAVNVSLLLDQPLLLTGEPGTGKTQVAYRIAWELGLEPVLRFDTKSTSQARDLFYTYDALGRFHGSADGGKVDPQAYVQFGPLGLATLLASDEPATRKLLDPSQAGQPPTQSVVLIDEIDKAPRDFPNDILNEIEHFRFRIPELRHREVFAPRERRPVVVITSNSEKDLPDAFLRRCVFYHIAFPEKDQLQQILEQRLGTSIASGPFLAQAIDLFFTLRSGQLRKKPATAEMIGWIVALRQAAPNSSNPLDDRTVIDRTISTVIKTVEDQEEALRLVRQWAEKPR